MNLNAYLCSSARMFWKWRVIKQSDFMLDAFTNSLIRMLHSVPNRFLQFSSNSSGEAYTEVQTEEKKTYKVSQNLWLFVSSSLLRKQHGVVARLSGDVSALSRTHTGIRSGMLLTRLLMVSRVIFFQTSCRLSARRSLQVAVGISSILLWMIAKKFSIGDRSGLLGGRISFRQKFGRCFPHHSWLVAAMWAGAPSCWKIMLDMSGWSLTVVGGPFSRVLRSADLRYSYVPRTLSR